MIFQDDLAKLILVSIRIPGLELEPTNPALLLDALAGGVLRDLLTVELAAENLLTERPRSGPASFMGYFMFAVEDVRRARIIIWSILRRTELESYTTVFQLCPEEGVWKSISPEGITMFHEDLVADAVALSAKARGILAVWQQAAQRSNSPPPSNEPAEQ